MSLLSDTVKELLRALDWGLSRRATQVIRGILISILLLAPGAFILGANALANDDACTIESAIVPAFPFPHLAPIEVVNRNGHCTVKVMPALSPVRAK